jgi:tRNA U34 5-carboxymethylaminomethyl modifying GTPase MnmE/TrmE
LIDTARLRAVAGVIEAEGIRRGEQAMRHADRLRDHLRRRHLDALTRAREHVESAAQAVTSRRASELFAEVLRLAQHAL